MADPVLALGTAVETLLAVDPAAMVDVELASDLVRLRREMDRLESVFTQWTAAANTRGVGVADGHPSTPAWVAWKTGLHRGAVNRTLRTAAVCELLPETAAAWRAGDITASAVATIAEARVEGADDALMACEAEFLGFARRRDHKSLRTVARHFAVCARADGSAPGPVDGITLSTVGDRVVLRGEFHADAAETLSSAIHAFTPSPTVEDGTTAAQRRAGGLLEVCKVALGRGSEAPRTRPAVSYVTQPREADDPHPMMLGEFTGVIGPRDRDRILCDCDRTEVQVDGAGRPLSVGRSTRTWPVPIRKAIVARDGGCRWPGCDAPAPWCDAHHLVHWEHGGGTSVGNGVLQCPRHHTFLHRHPDWTTTFFEQRFRVFRPDGTEVDPDPWTGLDRGS